MDKLVEISRFFNVSVDELVSKQEKNYSENFVGENVIIEEQKVSQKSGSKLKVIIIIIVVLLLLGILSKAFLSSIFETINNTFETVNQQIGDVNEQKSDIFSQVSNVINQIFEEVDEINNKKEEVQKNLDKVQEIIDKNQDEFEIKSFNGTFELYEGIIKGVQVKSLLSEVLTNNRKEVKKITVIYENQNVTDEKQLKNVTTELESFIEYDSYFKYDEDGYIYEVNISKL